MTKKILENSNADSIKKNSPYRYDEFNFCVHVFAAAVSHNFHEHKQMKFEIMKKTALIQRDRQIERESLSSRIPD